MAIVTKTLGGDTNVIFEVDYDDVNLRLTALRCINNSPNQVWAQATQLSNRRTYQKTFDANSTTEINIPTGVANRLNITITPSGKIDGVDYFTMSPA